MLQKVINPRSSLVNARLLLFLILGILLGFSLAMVFDFPSSRLRDLFPYNDHPGTHDDPHSSKDFGSHSYPKQIMNNRTHVHATNQSMANQLYNEVRISCLVMTTRLNHEKKAKHVLRTWGKRCNKIVFISTEADADLGAIELPVPDDRDYLWERMHEAFRHVYEHHYDEADWFLKVDDDTYVIMENLRYMLYPYLPRDPIYFGYGFNRSVKSLVPGSSSYVLSKQALRLFINEALTNETLCRQNINNGDEDSEIEKCMQNVGIIAGNSRDSKGRGRLFPFAPEHHLIPRNNRPMPWYWKYLYNQEEDGFDYCSDNAVSFHYITANQMYVMDFLIYHLQPYGIVNNQDDLPDKIRMSITNV